MGSVASVQASYASGMQTPGTGTSGAGDKSPEKLQLSESVKTALATFSSFEDALKAQTASRHVGSDLHRQTRQAPSMPADAGPLQCLALPSNPLRHLDLGTYSAPAVFAQGNETYMLVGKRDGTLDLYQLGDQEGLTPRLVTERFGGLDVGENSAPTVFARGNETYLLVGKDDGSLNLYRLVDEKNGLTPKLVNDTFGGLGVGSVSSTPTVFTQGNETYLLVGKDDGSLNLYQLTGDDGLTPKLITERFGNLDVGYNSAPATFTWENQTYLLVGKGNGAVNLYLMAGQYGLTPELVAENFGGLDAGSDIKPTVFTWGNETYLLVGKDDGSLNLYRLVDSDGLTPEVLTPNFGGLDVGIYSAPTVFVRGNNTYLLVGKGNGALNLYLMAGQYGLTPELVAENFGGLDVGINSAPTVFTRGNETYLLVGEFFGTLKFYRLVDEGGLTPKLVTNRFGGLGVGRFSAPTVFTQGNKTYLFVGEENGTLDLYQLGGDDSLTPQLVAERFGGLDVGIESVPTVFTRGNETYLLVGEQKGTLNLYRLVDEGGLTPKLVARNFGGLNVGFRSAPTAITRGNETVIIVGSGSGELYTAIIPEDYPLEDVILLRDGDQPTLQGFAPLSGLDVGRNSRPVATTYDDRPALLSGGRDGRLHLFTNKGSEAEPNWVEVAGQDNPYGNITVLQDSIPGFAEINGTRHLLIAQQGSSHIESHVFDGGQWQPQNASEGLFAGLDLGRISDFDVTEFGGKTHLVVAQEDGFFRSFVYNATDGGFQTHPNGTEDPFGDISARLGAPAFYKLDGQAAMVVGNAEGELQSYLYNGTHWTGLDASRAPFANHSLPARPAPVVLYQQDGTPRLYAGAADGHIYADCTVNGTGDTPTSGTGDTPTNGTSTTPTDGTGYTPTDSTGDTPKDGRNGAALGGTIVGSWVASFSIGYGIASVADGMYSLCKNYEVSLWNYPGRLVQWGGRMVKYQYAISESQPGLQHPGWFPLKPEARALGRLSARIWRALPGRSIHAADVDLEAPSTVLRRASTEL